MTEKQFETLIEKIIEQLVDAIDETNDMLAELSTNLTYDNDEK